MTPSYHHAIIRQEQNHSKQHWIPVFLRNTHGSINQIGSRSIGPFFTTPWLMIKEHILVSAYKNTPPKIQQLAPSKNGWLEDWWIFFDFSFPMIHPQKLTWNLEMMVSNRNLLFQGSIFRFHVCFGGCKFSRGPNAVKLPTRSTSISSPTAPGPTGPHRAPSSPRRTSAKRCPTNACTRPNAHLSDESDGIFTYMNGWSLW